MRDFTCCAKSASDAETTASNLLYVQSSPSPNTPNKSPQNIRGKIKLKHSLKTQTKHNCSISYAVSMYIQRGGVEQVETNSQYRLYGGSPFCKGGLELHEMCMCCLFVFVQVKCALMLLL